MSPNELLHQPVAQAIGWALLHFVWQGALIGALAWATLALLRRSAADVRYVVATVALLLMTTMPLVTGWQVWAGDAAAPGVAASEVVNTPAPIPAPSPMTRSERRQARPVSPAARAWPIDVEPWLPLLVAGWIAGVLMLTARLATGWVCVQRMKTRGTSPAGAALESAALRLVRRLRISRRVRLLETAHVDVPTVIGWLKPVVLVPASALAGLTPMQIEAILAHELAHVRRHDYVVNLLQTFVETLLFYHPAVWWVSRTIRAERENCCDDLAVRLCGDPFTYAQALADLESLRGAGGQLAMAASGGSLLHRVRRLLGAPTHAGRAPGWLAGSAAVLLLLSLCAGAVGSSVVGAQAPVVGPPQPEAPMPAIASAPRGVAAATVADLSRPAGGPDAARTSARGEIDQAATGLRAVIAASASAVAGGAAALAGATRSLAGAQSVHATTSGSSGSVIWSHNGARLEVHYDGEFEFTEDDADVKRLAPGSTLSIKEGGLFGARSVEFTADATGAITRRYREGMFEKPFDPAGRAWLAQALPKVIRQTGLGAEARVARILASQGPAGVLREISLIQGSWGKRLYFTELLKAPIDPPTARQVLLQAGKEIDSDYELATLLIAGSDKLLVDDASRQAYFDAAKSIESDYEMHRVYKSALEHGPVSGALIAGLLDASRAIQSDSEEASLLVQVAGLQPLDAAAGAAFFQALDSIGSDYERGRVLKALLARKDGSPDAIVRAIRSAGRMGSDHEKGQVLQAALSSSGPLSGEARDAYIDVASSLGDYEQGRALSALVRAERR